jgi:hypothetical protein
MILYEENSGQKDIKEQVHTSLIEYEEFNKNSKK